MRNSIILILVFFVPFFAQAQDVIYTKTGSVFRGEIIKYEEEGRVELQIATGDTIKLARKRIRKIIQKGAEKPLKYKGWFYHLQPGLNGGGRKNESLTLGVNFQNTIGYQYNRWIGLGLNVGVDKYFGGRDLTFIPIALNARGYFLNRSRTPYYSVDFGYGYAILGDEQIFNRARGGMMFHPAIGIRFGGHNGAFTLDFGVKVQDVTLHYDSSQIPDRWWGQPWLKKVEKTRYMRSVVRFGWLF